MQLLFADLLDHALAYAGDDATRAGTTKCRRAVQNAYKVVPTRQEWSYLWKLGRVTTVAAYETGTVQYVVSTNQLTLTGGTWPSWAASGYLTVNNRPYQVATRESGTVLTLDTATAPTADIDAGTTYMIAQDQYTLAADFLCADETVINEVGAVLEYMHPRNWASERRTNTGPGQPWMFSFVGDQNHVGRNKMVLWPPPDGIYAVDFLYRRLLRPMVYEVVEEGLASVAASGTTVTGTNTAFKGAMVGSYIRLGVDNQTAPTGETGGNPAAFEARITAVASATSLTVDTAAAEALDSVRYVISDPADIDVAVMQDYLLREVEYQFRQVAREKPTPTEQADYDLALLRAREADNRSTSRSAALRKQTRRSGFIHYPIQFTGG